MTQQPHITHPIPEQWCLVFADYPLGEPAMDAIQGPRFFSSKREALIEYLKYLSPRLEQEGGLGEFLDALSDLGMVPKTLVADTSGELLRLAETAELEILEGICAGYGQDRTSEGREVIFLLEAVPPARQPSFPPVTAPPHNTWPTMTPRKMGPGLRNFSSSSLAERQRGRRRPWPYAD
ncbi:hypothetical protein LLH04_31130 (plasmid) [Pseudomonas aeruginosa]|uniref:hypothetical protein n=1 Tax=Pseudomonas aeruginosa TaxID=287 RepID=UPI001D197B94|nr:hypothetical protein [Pseudomonas aeruginosa]UEG09206.1 hypothetical protein LLH04_31130 [Pseudomonas aeruginosa]